MLGASGSVVWGLTHTTVCEQRLVRLWWELETLSLPSPQVWVPASGSVVLTSYERFLCFLETGRPPSWTTGSVSATEMICQGNVSTGNHFSPAHLVHCTRGSSHLGGSLQADLLSHCHPHKDGTAAQFTLASVATA